MENALNIEWTVMKKICRGIDENFKLFRDRFEVMTVMTKKMCLQNSKKIKLPQH